MVVDATVVVVAVTVVFAVDGEDSPPTEALPPSDRGLGEDFAGGGGFAAPLVLRGAAGGGALGDLRTPEERG